MKKSTRIISMFICMAMLVCFVGIPLSATSLSRVDAEKETPSRYEGTGQTETVTSSANPLLPETGLQETVNYPFENASVYILNEKEMLADMLDRPIALVNGHWIPSVSREYTDSRSANDIHYLSAVLSPAGESVEFLWSTAETVRNAKSIAFGMRADPILPDGHSSADLGVLAVTVSMECGEQIQVGKVYLTAGNWVIINVALPMQADKLPVKNLAVQMDYENHGIPLSVQITNPHHSDTDCVLIEEFSADEILPVLGDVQISSHWLYLEPNEAGAVSFVAQTNLPKYVAYATEWYMAVTVEGTAAGGSVSVGTHSGKASDSWRESAAVQVTAGSHTYLFPLPVEMETVHTQNLYAGAYASLDTAVPGVFRLSFQNVTGQTDDSFRISHIAMWQVEEPQWFEGNLGSLGVGQVQNGEMVWRGKLTRQAATAYREAEIALLAVPVWNRYNLNSARELDRVQVSNSYTFTLPVQGREQYGAGWLFYAAIRVTRKSQEQNAGDIITYLPISQPKMLAGETIEPRSLSMFGFHGASAVGVYESNVSHVTVDVVWEKLFSDSDKGIAAGFGGSNVWLSQSYLAELDRDILFYCDAGLEVGLRLTVEKGGTLPHADTQTEAGRYMAAIWYLCGRYPAIASIILGQGINCENYSSGSLANPERVYPHVATLAALTYQTARLVIPDVYIVIPFANSQGYDSDTDAGGVAIDPETALVLFAAAMEGFGNIPWAVSWRLEDDHQAEAAALLFLRWKQLLQTLSLPVFGDFLYRWEPDTCLAGESIPYNLTNRYEILCEILSPAKPRAVILSLTHIAETVSQSMYGQITALQDPSGSDNAVRQVQKLTGTLSQTDRVPESGKAMTTIWDFTESYDKQGFVAGGGIDQLYTYRSPTPQAETGVYDRVLRSTLPMYFFENRQIGRSGGVLLRNFAGNVNLEKVDYLTFTYTLTETGESETSPTVVFLVGSEDFRAEYKVEGTISGKTVTAVCDLRQYTHAPVTGYIGVMLYGETELVFDLSSVKAWSGRLTATELADIFTHVEPEAPSPYQGEVLTMLILVGISSVCITVLFIRRDREEEQKERDGEMSFF